MRKNYNKIHDLKHEEQSQIVKGELGDVNENTDGNIPDASPPTQPKMAIVISLGKLNVRMKPSKGSSILCVVDPGSQLLIESVDSDWAHAYTSSGIEGYVMAEFIKEV